MWEPVRGARALQGLAQPRPLGGPAADADVDVIALRKDPGVSAGNRPEVDHRTPSPAVIPRVGIGDVALQCDPCRRSPKPSARAVRPLTPSAPITTAPRRRFRRTGPWRPSVHLGAGRPNAVAEVGARCSGLGGEVRVEQRRRWVISTSGARPPGRSASRSGNQLEAVDDLLDDGIDGDRQLFDRSLGQPAAAGLVAWEPGSGRAGAPSAGACEAKYAAVEPAGPARRRSRRISPRGHRTR